jgi:formylglycine-generating enzyme required for sulfatase activity
VAGISLITPAFAVVNITYVPIGNAGNLNDAATGSVYGAVAYAYKIAQNETTISQYAEFLNAAAKTNTYGLYNTSMGTDINVGGISRSGASGSYTYSVLNGGNRPIAYVSWFDAARYCNWLQNGQGSGSTETGAYTLAGAMSGIITKNVGATVWIPSESEWYKAAYYDPNKGGAGVGGYWAQATQSNTVKGNTVGVATSANYHDGDYATYTGGTSWGVTDGGAYGPNSDSAYGTNDQAGNVFEWNDAVISGSSRGLRGGSWNNSENGLRASDRIGNVPSNEFNGVGFRVASVPEPTSILLTMLAGGMMLARRKR